MPTKVLVISGVAHCGSTFLGRLLGELDGFFFAGGVHLSAASLEREWACGCGEQHRVCPVWTGVYEAAFAGTASAPSELGLPRRDERALALLRPAHPARLAAQRAAFGRLFAALPAQTGARVVVDSSKAPGYARFLAGVEGVDLRILHLVRDPRATVHSWLREQEGRSGGPRFGPAAVAAVWSVWNPAIELAFRRGRYLRLRHEDLVADPEAGVRRILELVEEDVPQLPLRDGRHVELGAAHVIAGNPNRFERGTVEVRRDDAWREAGGGWQRQVSALTWPLRLRYGYPK
jgi:hypothetical protein